MIKTTTLEKIKREYLTGNENYHGMVMRTGLIKDNRVLPFNVSYKLGCGITTAKDYLKSFDPRTSNEKRFNMILTSDLESTQTKEQDEEEE